MKKGKNKITIKTVPMKDYREFHVTLKNIGSDGEVFLEMLEKLEKEEILISKVVFFGDTARIEKFVLVVRGKYPFLIIGNSLPDEAVNAYILGIKIIKGESQAVELGGEIIGRYFDLPDFEYLNVGGISLKSKQETFIKETENEYKKISEVLVFYDFSLKDIYRFWNYMSMIWDNYFVFNEARNEYFEKNKIVKFPAATGIEADLGFGKNINLGFEAIKSKSRVGFEWGVASSGFQIEPHKYDRQVSDLPQGPRFSRAAYLDYPKGGLNKFYISGISSANKRGESSLVDNPRENVAYVMASFIDLLEKKGFSLGNLVSTHVYFKNKNISQEFERLYIANDWKFPVNYVFTNICRENFLFEIEGVASDWVEDYFFE